MIEYIKGQIESLNPAAVTVETAAGVAYLLNISLTTYDALDRSDKSQPVKLLVHESIREDAWTLYGFADTTEREMFRLLIGVSGVGAGSARMILSAIPPAELSGVISAGDARRLKSVKGIGAKTAERIIIDLRDKIKECPGSLIVNAAQRSAAYDEALAALSMLGFDVKSSRKAVDAIFDADPTVTVEMAIKKALSMM